MFSVGPVGFVASGRRGERLRCLCRPAVGLELRAFAAVHRVLPCSPDCSSGFAPFVPLPETVRRLLPLERRMPLAAALTLSPMTAMTLPTGTTAPGWAWMCRTPASSASISTLLLSVSISAMTSPAFTVSPSCFCQESSVPSSIASPILGIITSAIGSFCF